jgi:hypothetical protein
MFLPHFAIQAMHEPIHGPFLDPVQLFAEFSEESLSTDVFSLLFVVVWQVHSVTEIQARHCQSHESFRDPVQLIA